MAFKKKSEREREKEIRKGKEERREGRKEKEKGKEEERLRFRVPSKEENQVWILRLPFVHPVMLSKICTPLLTL